MKRDLERNAAIRERERERDTIVSIKRRRGGSLALSCAQRERKEDFFSLFFGEKKRER